MTKHNRRKDLSLGLPGHHCALRSDTIGSKNCRKQRLHSLRPLQTFALTLLFAGLCGPAKCAQDASGGASGMGRNLSEQELGSVDVMESCAAERHKLVEERVKFEGAQEMLASQSESMHELLARNRALESSLHEAEQVKLALTQQLHKVTAVNVTDVGTGQEHAMRSLSFEFAERLAADAMHAERDTKKLMHMSERLLEVVRGSTGGAAAKEKAARWVAANSGHDKSNTRNIHGSKHSTDSTGAEQAAWKKWKEERRHDAHSLDGQEIFSKSVLSKLKDEVHAMFTDSFESYMQHAYPYDELRPLSCSGKNVFGPKGYALTLIDSLDTLAILGDFTTFDVAIRRVIREITFDVDVNVSVFETNIRAVGGLLSAHFLAMKFLPWYSDELLKMCVDLANR